MRNRLVDDTHKRCDHKFHGWSWNLKKHINAQQNSSFDERHSMLRKGLNFSDFKYFDFSKNIAHVLKSRAPGRARDHGPRKSHIFRALRILWQFRWPKCGKSRRETFEVLLSEFHRKEKSYISLKFRRISLISVTQRCPTISSKINVRDKFKMKVLFKNT